MKVEVMKIEDVKPYWRNPRVNDKTVELLEKSIKKFGYTVPIIIDKENVIISGHARYKALNNLYGTLDYYIEQNEKKEDRHLINQLKEINKGNIQVVVADYLDEKKVKEFRIADNKIPNHSKWDLEHLKFELRDLDEVLGFDVEEIKILLGSINYDVEIKDNTGKGKEIDINTQFKELVENNQQRFIEIRCPYCHKVITLDENVIG